MCVREKEGERESMNVCMLAHMHACHQASRKINCVFACVFRSVNANSLALMVPPLDKIAFRGNDLTLNVGNSLEPALGLVALDQPLSHTLVLLTYLREPGDLLKVIV